MKFVKLDNAIVPIDRVESIDDSDIENWVIRVKLRDDPNIHIVTGFFAAEFVYTCKPSALEGKRMRWRKHAWSVHNLIAHPAMQVFAYFKCYKAAMWIHDVTAPKPVAP